MLAMGQRTTSERTRCSAHHWVSAGRGLPPRLLRASPRWSTETSYSKVFGRVGTRMSLPPSGPLPSLRANGATPDAQRSGVLRALLRVALRRGFREGSSPRRPASIGATGRRRRASPRPARATARRTRARSSLTDSAVPDVLAPGVEVVFCGINPGRSSADAGLHFANPRNDFWRLLHAADFTRRLLAPANQGELPELGIGLTNAALRTTRGSSDLRAADFAGARERLESLPADLPPRVPPLVGDAHSQGA